MTPFLRLIDCSTTSLYQSILLKCCGSECRISNMNIFEVFNLLFHYIKSNIESNVLHLHASHVFRCCQNTPWDMCELITVNYNC